MFDVFGEFDSWEEINLAASAQLAEGDIDAIKKIAEENGLEDIEDFIDGEEEKLVFGPLDAALGKIKVECKELNTDSIISMWVDIITQLCTEDKELAIAMRRKGKRISLCMAELLKFSFKNKKVLDKKIVEAAGLRAPLYVGIPSNKETKDIIRKYYLEG